ncbi:hypothetical protein LCGC14_2265020 [marine sediment metagenome]|uniref:Uncharacterized protein n=1 Tax=marine sediment metagenome TaxID=412755 RepID=A0A0F9DKT9_9ZZZZ
MSTTQLPRIRGPPLGERQRENLTCGAGIDTPVPLSWSATMPEPMSDELIVALLDACIDKRDVRAGFVLSREVARLRSLLVAAEAVCGYAEHGHSLDLSGGVLCELRYGSKEYPGSCDCGFSEAWAKWRSLRGGGDGRPCFNCETRPRTHGQLCETCHRGAEKLLGKLGLGGGD